MQEMRGSVAQQGSLLGTTQGSQKGFAHLIPHMPPFSSSPGIPCGLNQYRIGLNKDLEVGADPIDVSPRIEERGGVRGALLAAVDGRLAEQDDIGIINLGGNQQGLRRSLLTHKNKKMPCIRAKRFSSRAHQLLWLIVLLEPPAVQCHLLTP